MNQLIQTHLLSGNMKYIITEQQYNFLSEQEIPNWFKRRYNITVIRTYIDEVIELLENDLDICSDYDNASDYANSVIYQAVTKFMTTDEDIFNHERFDELDEKLIQMCMDEYEDELFDIYRETCYEED